MKGALRKDEDLWPWVLQLLSQDVPCFFFSVEDVLDEFLVVLEGAEMN